MIRCPPNSSIISSASASSSSNPSRQMRNAPRRNSSPTMAVRTRCGSKVRSEPAATAMTTCVRNAAAIPVDTHGQGNRVPSTRLATAVLSGSSPTKMRPNTVAMTAKSSIGPSRVGGRNPAPCLFEHAGRQPWLSGPNARPAGGPTLDTGRGTARQYVDIQSRDYSRSPITLPEHVDCRPLALSPTPRRCAAQPPPLVMNSGTRPPPKS